MRREHRKPLSHTANEILLDLRRLTGNRAFVFPSIRSPQRPISENALNGALRRLGYTQGEATSHGFRASASSLLNESGKWYPDAIEAELGHLGADQVRRAYHRATCWDERVRMAEWWASEVNAMLAMAWRDTRQLFRPCSNKHVGISFVCRLSVASCKTSALRQIQPFRHGEV
jgi:integrase